MKNKKNNAAENEVATETTEVTEDVCVETEEPAAFTKTDVIDVSGAKKAAEVTAADGTTAVYIMADGKVPAVIWTSEEVDDLGAVIEALGVEGDAKYVYGFGKQKIEYQHNSNKTKTVTYTFTAAK